MQQIENTKEETIIEGVVEFPSQRQHLFKNKSALLDFIKWSTIENASFRSGILQSTGERVFELTYNTNEN